MNIRALIVDDDPSAREALLIKTKRLGHEVETVGSQTEAFSILEKVSFHYALVDLHMIVTSGDSFPDKTVGLETIEHIRNNYPQMKIIAVTAYDEQHETTRDSLKYGADDFWSKNINKNRESIESKITRLVVDPGRTTKSTKSMDEIEAEIKKLARLDVTVLLLGETGTGKSYYAEQIHQMSKRKAKKFIAINCATLKGDFFVSEIFGHEKGSFSGAVKKRPGAAKAAIGGTLFLDEIGDLDSECQAKLLRFVETKEIKPLGSDNTEEVDVRIILATNKDLKIAVDEGKFREDLFARISAYSVTIPPLRERKPKEITKLAKSIYRSISQKPDLKQVRIKKDVFDQLGKVNYSWPGNVRELTNSIEKAILFRSGRDIQVKDILEHCDNYVKSSIEIENDSLLYSNHIRSLSERERKVIAILKSEITISRIEIQKKLGIGSTTTWKLLKDMSIKGLIQKVGSGNNIQYALKE